MSGFEAFMTYYLGVELSISELFSQEVFASGGFAKCTLFHFSLFGFSTISGSFDISASLLSAAFVGFQILYLVVFGVAKVSSVWIFWFKIDFAPEDDLDTGKVDMVATYFW